MMIEFVLFFAVLASSIGYALFSARFYLRVTEGISSHTLLAKLRNPIRLASKAFAILMMLFMIEFGLYLLEIFTTPAIVVWLIAGLSAFLLTLLVIAPFMTLLSDYSRPRALASVEGRVVRLLLVAAVAAITFAWKAFTFILKHSANSRSRGGSGVYGTPGNRRGPWHQESYMTYEEQAKRNNGEWY